MDGGPRPGHNWPMIWFCVMARIVANPCSNVLQKLLTRNAAHEKVSGTFS